MNNMTELTRSRYMLYLLVCNYLLIKKFIHNMSTSIKDDQMFLKHKIVFLGDQAVGKTSIILRFS